MVQELNSMKKFLISSLLLAAFLISTPVVHSESVGAEEVSVTPFFRMVQYKFKNYPPSTYKGKVLIYVEKVSGGYTGWYR